jgi:hypothetical protein
MKPVQEPGAVVEFKLDITEEERAIAANVLRSKEAKHNFKPHILEDGTKVPLYLSTPQAMFTLSQALGSLDSTFTGYMLNRLSTVIEIGDDEQTINTIISMLYALAPRNETEAMLAAQIIATQHVSMKMLANSLKGNTTDIVNHYANRAHKLQSLMVRQLELYHLMQKGGQTTQKVIIERVEVKNGGQAVVGAVGVGGGQTRK